jgi:hypothetical protein
MCFGGGGKSVSARTEEIYQKEKKDYGELPSLAMGDRAERTEESVEKKSVSSPKKSDPTRKRRAADNRETMIRGLAKQTKNEGLARSLLMPYNK